MKQKRWLALLLALVLALSLGLTACGGRDADDDDADEKTEETAAPEKTDPPEDEEADAGEDTHWIEDGLFMFGTVEGDAYENEALGIGCTLADWTFADADKLAEINQFGSNAFDDDVKKALESAQTVTEMYAERRNPTQNIVITVQNMRETYGFTLGEEQLLDISLPQMPDLMEGAGYTDINAEKTTTVFCGEEHACIRLTAKIYGIDIYQMVIPIAVDDYMFSITFSTFESDTLDEILALFYSL